MGSNENIIEQQKGRLFIALQVQGYRRQPEQIFSNGGIFYGIYYWTGSADRYGYRNHGVCNGRGHWGRKTCWDSRTVSMQKKEMIVKEQILVKPVNRYRSDCQGSLRWNRSAPDWVEGWYGYLLPWNICPCGIRRNSSYTGRVSPFCHSDFLSPRWNAEIEIFVVWADQIAVLVHLEVYSVMWAMNASLRLVRWLTLFSRSFLPLFPYVLFSAGPILKSSHEGWSF